MKKLLFTLFITIVFLPAIHNTISAQPTPVAPSGLGTEANPWQIATLANLYWITASDAEVPSPTQAIRWTKYYIQTANIDFSPTLFNWSPIGDSVNNFIGHYNGMSFTINSLSIYSQTRNRMGLFGVIGLGAVISNIGLTRVNITGHKHVGGLVGVIEGGTVTNSYTTGVVGGVEGWVGGMVGTIESGTITNAYSTAGVGGEIAVGGMVGYIHSGTITNAYAAGSVSYWNPGGPGPITPYINKSTAGDIGGLIGKKDFGTFNNCFWDTESSGQSSSSGGTGKTFIEMRVQSTFTGWDFTPGTGQWQIASAGSGYRYCPCLQGFTYDVPFTTAAVNPLPGLIWSYSGGDGTSGSPFQIAIPMDLKYLSEQSYDWYLHFIQTANIDATAIPGWNLSGGFSPIGSSLVKFTGNYNGNYHTITGLYINRPLTDDIGLFGYVGSSGSISKVGLVDVAITGKENVGGLVGYFNASTGSIANTYVTGSVSAQTDVGGLAGEIRDGTVTNVYSTANVTGDRGVGGLVAAAWDSITNAYSTGHVTGNTYAGGLIGWEWYITVVNSFWDKQTSGQNSSAKGTGKTTSEMKTKSDFTSWDFTAGTGVWNIREIASLYKSYPYLQGFTYDEPAASPVVNPIPGLTDLSYSGGIGTPENPYQIETLTDLKNLSENSTDWSKYYIQTANIDAASTSGWNSGAGFSPIGNQLTNAFTGNYSSGYLTLKPYTDGNTIGIAGGAGTLSLPTAYFTTNFVDGFSGITIGSSTAGNIGIKAIPFNDPVTFNAAVNLNLENDIDLNGQTITLGATTVTRGHTNQSWGGKNSVLRYYDIAPTNNTGLNATMVFNYNDAELNSLTESKLFLCKSTDGGTSYSCEGGTVNTSANTITLAGIAGFSRWMAAEIMTLTWNGTGSDFNTAANWTPNATPSTFYNIAIPDVAIDPIVNQAPATPAICNNLSIASGVVVAIAAGKALTVSGTLANSGGNAGLVVKSTADGTGSLLNNTAGVSGTVERYIPAADWLTVKDGWHNLSSPVASQTISTEFVHGYQAGTEDFYKWDEATNYWINIKASGGTGWTPGFETSFAVGRGYLVAYENLVTKNFAGTLNVADIPVSGLAISSGANSGWHFLGNPFASAITWYTDWTKANIGGVADIWNEAGQSYTPISAGGIIPSGNGFMVQASGGTGSLTIPASKRAHNAQAWYKNSDYPVIKLFAHNLDDPSFQESQLRFNPASTTGFDVEHDGHFLPGYAPLFYSVMAGEKMMVNSLPELTAETVIPFTFIKNEGTNFTIEASGMETLQPAATVFLKDKKLGIDHNLSENPVYAFTSTTGDSPARFELHFGSVGINELPSDQTIIAWYYGGAFNMKNVEGLATIGIFNIRGQQLQNFQLNGSGLQTVQLNLPAGVYVARIVNNGRMRILKIVVQ